MTLRDDNAVPGESDGRWPAGTQLFSRLPASTKPGHVVDIDGQAARVMTAKLADDLRDAKCTVVILPASEQWGWSVDDG